MNKKLLILLLAFSPLFGLYAQTGNITGRVADAETNRPLPSVTVKVATQQAFTDGDGLFSITGVATGDVVVEFILSGYENINQFVNVGESTNLGTIKMTPSYLNDLSSGGLSEISISSDSDDDSKGQNISGLLSSSNDVFARIASFTFGPAYFRMRGYDNDLGGTYIGNTSISDV